MWAKVLDGRAGLDVTRAAQLAGLVREWGSGVVHAPPRPAPGDEPRRSLELAAARVLVALEPEKIRQLAGHAEVSPRSVRRWLSGDRQPSTDLRGLVTHGAVEALNPALDPWSRGLPHYPELFRNEPARFGEMSALKEPEVLGLNLDYLALFADRARSPLPAWIRRTRADGHFLLPCAIWTSVGLLPRLEVQARLLPGSRPYRQVLLLREYCAARRDRGSEPLMPTLAKLYLDRRFPRVASLRLELSGSAFASGLAPALVDFVLRPLAEPSSVRLAAVDVALDLACAFDRVFEVYGGRGHDFEVWTRRDFPFAATYRRSGSNAAKMAVYDLHAEHADGFAAGGSRRLKTRRHYPGHESVTRMELRLRRLVALGLASPDDIIAALPGLFARWNPIDVHRVLSGQLPGSLLTVALRLIQQSGHSRRSLPTLADAARRGLDLTVPGHTDSATAFARERKHGDARAYDEKRRRRVGDQIGGAMLAAGRTSRQAEAAAADFHAASAEALPLLAQHFPVFEDISEVVRAHSGQLRHELANVLAPVVAAVAEAPHTEPTLAEQSRSSTRDNEAPP